MAHGSLQQAAVVLAELHCPGCGPAHAPPISGNCTKPGHGPPRPGAGWKCRAATERCQFRFPLRSACTRTRLLRPGHASGSATRPARPGPPRTVQVLPISRQVAVEFGRLAAVRHGGREDRSASASSKAAFTFLMNARRTFWLPLTASTWSASAARRASSSVSSRPFTSPLRPCPATSPFALAPLCPRRTIVRSRAKYLRCCLRKSHICST